jgi:hypothetical protein
MGERHRLRQHDVQGFLDSLPPESRDVVTDLRAVVRRTVPDAEESLLWGGLSYHAPWIGGRVKGSVCQISAQHGEVRLEFIHGVRLDDSRRLLRGDRISKRYVPIRSVAEARRPEIADLIGEAATLELPGMA